MPQTDSEGLRHVGTNNKAPTLFAWLGWCLSRFKTACIIDEHHCSPPCDGRNWVAVKTDMVALPHRYGCLECGQQFEATMR